MLFFWIDLSLFGLGLFLLFFTALSSGTEAVSWIFLGRRRRSLALLRSTRPSARVVPATPDDLIGLGKIPWMPIYLLSMAAGLGLYALTRQTLTLFLAFVPFGVRTWLAGYRKRQVNAEVLAFLTDLRLAMPLQGSLLRALQDVAGREAEDAAKSPSARPGGRLAGMTARMLAGGFNGSGLELLEQLAAGTQAPYLGDLVAWTKAAEAGTLAADAPFEHALERLQAETYTAARENMQRIPIRLTVLVLPALLGPAIVVLLYPVVARLLANMGGVGWGGGF
jgi:hypothetical protein